MRAALRRPLTGMLPKDVRVGIPRGPGVGYNGCPALGPTDPPWTCHPTTYMLPGSILQRQGLQGSVILRENGETILHLRLRVNLQ